MMKQKDNNRLIRLAVTPLLPMVLFGCSDEMHVFRPNDGASGLRLELQATIDQTSDTRADESGFADGDRFGLFVVNYSEGNPGALTLSDNQVNNVAMTYNADANRWQATTDIYWRDPITPADVYGYYPFYNGMSNVNNYSFEVRADQSLKSDGEMSAYEASDFLWAKTPKATPGNKVELTFSHVMAGVKVVLQQGEGFDGDAWTKLAKTVTVDNTIRTSEIDLSTGIVTTIGSFDRNIVMNPEGDAWRAVVVPQTVAAGKTVIGITIDGKPYAYTRSDGMKYTPGKLHTFTIKIDRKEDGGDYTLTLVNEDITPWEADKSSHDFVENAYVTINCPEQGMLRKTMLENGIDFNTVRNLKISGILTTEDFDFMREELLSLTAINLRDVNIKNVNHKTYVDYTDEWELNDIIEDDVLPDHAFDSKTTLRRIILPESLKKLGQYSFASLELNSTVVIPESVTHLMSNVFERVRDGSTIIMPHSLEYIGNYAFCYCKADVELGLANSIRYIGKYAFSSANVYGTLNIPNNIEYIGSSAFAYSYKNYDNIDGEIIIPPSITEISERAFCDVNIKGGTKVILHDGITKIGEKAFFRISFAPGFTLPKNLKEIGKEAFRGCRFVENLIIPESVQIIGEGAFNSTNLKGSLNVSSYMDVISTAPLSDCVYEMGCFGYTQLENVIIGDNVQVIGGRAFYENNYLRSIKIGKNVDRIGMEAFANCPGLQNIVCLAKDPPKLYDNVFRDSDPLHCHLEVPEESIELYKNAYGWKDFRFISPHHELTVGLHEQSCLNKGLKRSVVIFSEGKWRVRNAPSWIHVFPDHGEYKEEITFTIDPLENGAGNREGKVIFELVEKDYTTECNFLQYDYEYNEDTQIVLQNASANGTPVNLFIVGDGFGANEIVNGNYLQHMNETMEQFFAIEPYKSYRTHFNVSTSIAMSPDNMVATLQDRRLDRLNTFGVDLDVPAVMEYAKETSGFISNANIKDAMVIVVSNMEAFAGKAYPDNDGCSLACVSISSDAYPYDQRALVQHFAGGQSFAGLAPEYITHNENIKGCTCSLCNALHEYYAMKEKGLFENISLSGKTGDVPWSEFIFNPKYSSLVDMWEGGYNHLGVWRSEPQSVMSTYIAYYNTISRYAICKSIMRRARLNYSLEDFIANDIIELP